MSQEFKRKYPNCRVIIDCTELFTETPKSLANKALLYSHYNSHMMYKGLVGISPGGLITFASDLWSGAINDKQITKQCGILDLCESGDAIMADKGFLITDLTTPKGIHRVLGSTNTVVSDDNFSWQTTKNPKTGFHRTSFFSGHASLISCSA